MAAENSDDQWVEDILGFWFAELNAKDWFVKSEAVDTLISERFADLYERLSRSLPAQCERSGRAALAAIITLDQLPRNMFRNSPKMFATDEMALGLAQATITLKLDKGLSLDERQFVYMPFQHSEDRVLQARSIELYEKLGDEKVLKFAIAHKNIIDRFGRFPHRNAVIGRDSSKEERDFLLQPGSSF